ncbi:MAG: M20 family metallopeptidase [Planctomycetes bacterium]|nr:M20 family metallopeptidase [Planctomycetota bacterium]
MKSRRHEAKELLARLVSCPSAGPSPGGAAPAGEAAMADLLASIVKPWGAVTRKVPIAPGRYNFIARFPGGGPRTLMLEAHADTVPADGMTIPPFEPAVRGGRLYGRGSCDTKASLAAMLLAIRGVLESGQRPQATLYFVATGCEETGGIGARRLVADGFRPDAAVIGEPTDLDIVCAHKGAYRCRVTAIGRAAHSSDPSRGISAIAGMARVVQALEGLLARRATRARCGSSGARSNVTRRSRVGLVATVSVGTIRGGTQVNVVADRCEIEVDRRTLPGETHEQVAAEIRRAVDAAGKAGPRCRYEFKAYEWYPAFEEDRRGPPARLVAAAARKVLGRARFKAVPWASNAGIFREAGIPCIVFGPGSIRQAHTTDEYVDLEQVAAAARVYAEIIRTF